MIIAVDTGGTKTLVARFTEAGYPEQVVKFPTPKEIDQYLQRVTDHIHIVANGQSFDTISIALPGVVRDGVALWCPNLNWRNVPIHSLLKERFPTANIIVANDANMAGLASMHRLDTMPRCGLYVTIGTGVGTSVVLNGEIIPALSDCEGGHMIVPYNEKSHIWEHIASGRALHTTFGDLSSATLPEVWSDIAERIAAGLQPLVAFTQPDIIVIGGSISSFVDYFIDTLYGLLAERLPAGIAVPKIISAPHSEEIVLYGCYDNAITKHR